MNTTDHETDVARSIDALVLARQGDGDPDDAYDALHESLRSWSGHILGVAAEAAASAEDKFIYIGRIDTAITCIDHLEEQQTNLERCKETPSMPTGKVIREVVRLAQRVVDSLTPLVKES